MKKKAVFISFVDGTGFAGACIVHVDDKGNDKANGKAALQEAWYQDCNPGGEAMIIPMSDEVRDITDPKYINRLLSRAEAEAWDNEILAKQGAK
jgi:hypothetical protein